MGLVIAGLVFVVTLLWCFFLGFASSMSDAPSQDGLDILPWFIGGTVISLLIAASHWSPHW